MVHRYVRPADGVVSMKQCQFAEFATNGVSRCDERATRKYGDNWFCGEHGKRNSMKLMYPRALELAEAAHKGQFRKKGNGEPYIEHCKRVAARFKNDDFRRTVGVLHDSFEDAPDYIQMIKGEFPWEVSRTIELLTHDPKLNYFDYIMKIRDARNQAAVDVKVSDLKDNLRDVKEGSKADKYRFALYILENSL